VEHMLSACLARTAARRGGLAVGPYFFFCLNEFQVWTFSINEFHFNPTGWIHLWIVEY
jgi:hypothetical protein